MLNKFYIPGRNLTWSWDRWTDFILYDLCFPILLIRQIHFYFFHLTLCFSFLHSKMLYAFLLTCVYVHSAAAAAAAKSLQSCPTLFYPIDSSPPGSTVPGILQARTLEWVAIAFSNAWKWQVKAKSLSCVRLFVTPWTAAYQAPLSMGFSRQEYWSGVPLRSPIYILHI